MIYRSGFCSYECKNVTFRLLSEIAEFVITRENRFFSLLRFLISCLDIFYFAEPTCDTRQKAVLRDLPHKPSRLTFPFASLHQGSRSTVMIYKWWKMRARSVLCWTLLLYCTSRYDAEHWSAEVRVRGEAWQAGLGNIDGGFSIISPLSRPIERLTRKPLFSHGWRFV